MDNNRVRIKMNKIFNFSAGPSMLPIEVLNQIQEELKDWNNLKVSVMEISHRSDIFNEVVHDLKHEFSVLLNIPNNYKIILCHGGARAQFSAIPMNLLRSSSHIADYIDSGYWSRTAAQEAEQYCKLNLIDVGIVSDNNVRTIKKMKDWELSYDSSYLHYCPNETIDGIAIREMPMFNNNVVVIGDFSSTLLSEEIDVSRFGIIYATSQKNIGIAGVTVVIIREDLLDRSSYPIPSIFRYSILNKYQSMFNTPVTFSWYVAKLVLKWIKRQGGLLSMSLRNQKKANLLYSAIDSSDCYFNNIGLDNRSYMNVPFYLTNKKLDKLFLEKSHDFGLYALKGHRIVGGMRASLYNAMPFQGVEVLVEFMKWFEKKYG